jgi:hypothetical protein
MAVGKNPKALAVRPGRWIPFTASAIEYAADTI